MLGIRSSRDGQAHSSLCQEVIGEDPGPEFAHPEADHHISPLSSLHKREEHPHAIRSVMIAGRNHQCLLNGIRSTLQCS